MNDDASRIDRSEIKNTGSNRLTNIASSFFVFAPTLSLYFRIHCRSRSVNIINSISSDFSFVYHKTFCFFALGLQIDRIRYTYIYIKLISRNDYRISIRVRIHVYFKFTQTLRPWDAVTADYLFPATTISDISVTATITSINARRH